MPDTYQAAGNKKKQTTNEKKKRGTQRDERLEMRDDLDERYER